MASFLGQKEIQRMLNLWLHGAMVCLLSQGEVRHGEVSQGETRLVPPSVAAGAAEAPTSNAPQLKVYQAHELEFSQWREV